MADPTPTNTRSDSVSSASSPPHSPRVRRGSSGLFANLEAQKRGDDPVSMARRQSMNDTKPQAGFLGKMWNNFVHGPSGPSGPST
ncbi:hypothetical protein CONLIGDRAFT_627390 [Coniochaeta ligniaria NRRL 30616]|uniref:Conidiation-specific protein 8 n=1 Tax=Coniochaeta ligniaria NRRL 30616 TaxID=1408157 RepID=A0A1J7JPL6_9PEZI|nr:hypothetical protein CONLIGDRAFT_627390 [Coniochaeta ligniaria NRRL 30616]